MNCFFTEIIFSGRKNGPTTKCHVTKKFGKWVDMVLYIDSIFWNFDNFFESFTKNRKFFEKRETFRFVITFSNRRSAPIFTLNATKKLGFLLLSLVYMDFFLIFRLFFLIMCKMRLIMRNCQYRRSTVHFYN